ncbi:hypothetical protein PRZ48_009827 [Zasmidium cellare]|uniref:Transcription factor domain-containing protein n=1 Tax=Zasmidium cellare TaxID=395010 RepID=A0ABR0ECT0_ZASCE|nr:hypothetical protein PRZ48_009827 [Zasmidium cellare]
MVLGQKDMDLATIQLRPLHGCYLGSSSSLSFSWQIRSLLKKITGDDFINLVPASEEDNYDMASASVRASLPMDSYTLPTREYAKYLAETTLFHLGPIYHVFEHQEFMQKLDHFYNDKPENRRLDGLWHMQLLLFIAFGKMFLRRGASALGPPGASEVLQALRIKTKTLDLWDDPILRVEVLCLISLYLLMADMRMTAYTYVCISSSSKSAPSGD